jgi:hypothetical protein
MAISSARTASDRHRRRKSSRSHASAMSMIEA